MARTSGTRPIGVPAQQIIPGPSWLGEITGFEKMSGGFGKIFRYSYREVFIDSDDLTQPVTGGKTGTAEDRWAINTCEINNTKAVCEVVDGEEKLVTQGNGLFLVRPVTKTTIVWMADMVRPDGSVGAIFQYENSDLVDPTGTDVEINHRDGEAPENDEDEYGEDARTDEYFACEDLGDGGYEEAPWVKWSIAQRVHYDHTESSTLDEYYRNTWIHPSGRIIRVRVEQKTTIDNPANC